MKSNISTYAVWMTWICILFLVPLLILVMYEERYFWEQARHLSQMREEYANYELGLKRMIAERQAERFEVTEEHLLGDAKKKMSISDDTGFTVVNRDSSYLLAAALAYMNKQGMSTDWYIPSEELSQPKIKTRTKKRSNTRSRTRASQRHNYVVTLDHDVRLFAESHRLISPLDPGSYWISSPFGPRQLRNGGNTFHYGIDMAAPYGTPVKAADHGVVIEAGRVKGFGNTILVSHGAHCKTRYAHLSSIKVEVGDTVVQGQVIGRVGNSGNTRGKNGVHLHWEVIGYGGKRFNPKIFLQRVRNA